MAKRSNPKLSVVMTGAASDSPVIESREIGRMPAWLGAAAIVLAVFWVYSPAIHGDWLWDDDWYITTNPLVRDASGLWKFWFVPGSWVEYYPVEETLLWIEWHLFGNDTFGYHVVTIALHAINALLVWRLLARLGLRKAWLGGFLFAVHPAGVDSVAWIAETKNTLVLMPFLLSVIAWIDYEQRRESRDYWRSLVLFLVAMLCKISVAPLPFVLLLYAWWKRRRVDWGDLKTAAPFFAIALGLGLLTIACGSWYYLHHEKFGDDAALGGPAFRIALAGQTLAQYVAHCFWPILLLPIYPQWKVDPSSPWQYFPWLVLLAIVLVAWRYKAGWGRHALLGCGYFVFFLVPFIGFVGTTFHNFTWVMDHFLYVPVLGLIGLIVAAVQAAEDTLSTAARPLITGAVTLVVVLLAIQARAYTQIYTDEASLWGYTLLYYPDSWLAHYNLGNAYFIAGQFPEAIPHYQRAIELHSNYLMAHNNLGLAYAQTGHLPEAKAQFEAALRISPNDESARHNLAQAQALLNAPR